MSSFVNLLDIIYPVGSIYYSYTGDASPASTIGGTWSRIKDTFLWFTSNDSNIGKTGGEQNHTLTVSEMPSHTHNTGKWTLHDAGSWANRAGATWTSDSNPYSNSSFDVDYTGGGGSHNNMPPYVQIAGWYRTA